ncbi:MAG TPA: RidA family protein [Miltoncostaeaceae bacterium]|nr:RidA family protein [Miltoncostaeaceae bacterium]
MTAPRRINPPTLFPGVPYDYAAVAPPGGLVFTAGACPLDAQGDVVGSGDLEIQALCALDNLSATLVEAGSSLDRVLKTTVYVATSDRSDLVRAWALVEERFGAARPPSTLLGVTVLGYRDQLVEIEAVAVTEPA